MKRKLCVLSGNGLIKPLPAEWYCAQQLNGGNNITIIFILYLNSPVLNCLKDFLLQPAPLLVKLSESTKKPAANIVMTVSSDTNDSGVTLGHASGVKKDSQDTSYQKVRKAALDSICRSVTLYEVA